METETMISAASIVALLVMGVLYASARFRVAYLESKVEALARVEKYNERLKRELLERDAQVMILKKEQYDELGADEFVALLNNIFGVPPKSGSENSN